MPNVTRIRDLASVVRSKNAGPFELTFDIMFPDAETYRRVKESGVITKELVARLYRRPVEEVLEIVPFDPAYAIKITMARPVSSGTIGDTDVYGAQQHAPLLNIEIP